MRSRPDVEIRMSKRAQPGDTLFVELALTSTSKTPVDFIDLDFEGHESIRLTTNNEIPLLRPLVHQVARVSEKSELAEEVYRFRASFRVPENAPPSYAGTLAEYRYRMTLHVSIPWWADVKEHYDVMISPRPVERRPPEPIASTSLRGNEPFLEVSIADKAFGPGDVISGSIAFGNVGGRKARALDLSLVGYERIRHRGRERVIEAYRFTGFKAVDAGSEGRELPFRFTVPRDAVPSFDGGGAVLFWIFEARLDLRGGADVLHQSKLTLLPFDRPAEPAGMRQRVGAGRWHAVWAEVGGRHGLGLDEVELQLTGEIEGCDVIVRTSVRDGKSGLSAELRWPSWGIGLSIGLRWLIDLGIDVEDPQFGRRYQVRGREPQQVLAALSAPLRRALLAFDESYVDDEHATVRAETPGHDQPWIGEFVGKVAVLAAAVRGASERVPPPASMADALPAWKAFAAGAGGRLQVGGMSLFEGMIDGAPIDVETELDRRGHPTGAKLTVRIDPPLPRAIDLGDAGELAAAPPTAREIYASITKRARAVLIEEQAITFELDGPLHDPANARDIIEAVLALAAQLRGDRRVGPYR